MAGKNIKLRRLERKMEKFLEAHRQDWRDHPEWLKLCEEYGPLYAEDYYARRALREILGVEYV